MTDVKNDKKIESIFANTEVRRYIADVIDKNIKEFNIPINEFEWSLAFLETYKKNKIGDDRVNKKKQNHSTEICNYIINNSGQSNFTFLKELFILIALLERDEIIKNSEEFTGEMFAWMLDPARSYLSKEARFKILEDINYILNRYGRRISLDSVSRRYVFKKVPASQSIDKDALCLYSNNIYIQNKTFNYKNADSTITSINISPASIRILEYLIGKGNGNINDWITKEDISSNLSLSLGAISNTFSFFRNKVFNIIKINLIEERGEDKDGKQYRINSKILP